MRLNSGEGNDPNLAGRTSQSTDRIARTARSVEICRYFLRAVLTLLPPVVDSTARVEMLYTL
jgi:hypothetical protein